MAELSRLILDTGRLELGFCSSCFGDENDFRWGREDAEDVTLRECKCKERHIIPLQAIYANPVMWAALVEHHIRESGVILEVE